MALTHFRYTDGIGSIKWHR